MSVPQDVVRRPLGRTARPRVQIAGWRRVGCSATPMGWPMDVTKTWHAAEVEALTEAGAAGYVSNLPAGGYFLDKRLDRCARVQCRTMVCAMAAGGSMRRSKGRKGRVCRSISFRKAAMLADEREISRLLKAWQGTRND